MRKIRALLYLLLIPLLLTAKESEEITYSHEGPFVIYQKEGTRVISSNANGVIFDTTYTALPENFSVDVTSTSGEYTFTVPLREHHMQRWELEEADETLIVSDLHGNMDATMALLTSNGVMDREGNWTYGENHLIVIGDIADRGRDDTAIYWLVYKLEDQAMKAGGRVILMHGNHEDMILRGDLRYVNKAHLKFAEEMGVEWDELYDDNSELGRWIRRKNIITVIGDNLYVHAGLSAEMVEQLFNIDEVNHLSYRYVGLNSSERNKMNRRNRTIFHSDGPLWYRGMARDSEKHPAITEEELERVLKFYGVERVFIGHSEVDEVESRYGGKVVAVNTPHYNNYPKNGTGGVLIRGDKIYSVNYRGERVLLCE